MVNSLVFISGFINSCFSFILFIQVDGWLELNVYLFEFLTGPKQGFDPTKNDLDELLDSHLGHHHDEQVLVGPTIEGNQDHGHVEVEEVELE